MRPIPKPLIDSQELARRNNENAAVYRAYLRRRRLRRKSGRVPAASKTRLSAKERDDLAWQEAEREARPIRAVGFFLPGNR